MEDNVAVIEIPQEKLTKKQLIKQAEDLNEYIAHLERNIEGYKKSINELNEEMNALSNRAERIILTMEKHYKTKIETILGVIKSIEVLLEQPDYSEKEEK